MTLNRKISGLAVALTAAFALLAGDAALARPKRRAPAPIPKPTPTPVSESVPQFAPADAKPALESLLKPKSVTRVIEDLDIITNSKWNENDFEFVNASEIRAPLSYARPKIFDWSLYPKMSSAIQKFEYDPLTHTIEMVGESHGLRMHSWVKVEPLYWDVIRFTIIRGDMTGFKVIAYLWDREGRTLTVAKGQLPGAKQMLPSLVALIFKPVSEIVLSVATKNFRSYIEEEYKKMKH